MIIKFKKFAFASLVAAASVVSASQKATAQTYPIDCAILLCLSGGWPASVPCTRARAEFIRRITPWPVEPPLQIWRCPMGASYQPRGSEEGPMTRIYSAVFAGIQPLPQSQASNPNSANIGILPAVLVGRAFQNNQVPNGLALQLVQDRADIDISGPEFNFVRSIRVYDVRYAYQRRAGRDDDCTRGATVFLGTYGIQGDFSWARSSVTALPGAHVGLEGWGQDCPSVYNRSVFVDWRDFEGNYGFEQVNY